MIPFECCTHVDEEQLTHEYFARALHTLQKWQGQIHFSFNFDCLSFAERQISWYALVQATRSHLKTNSPPFLHWKHVSSCEFSLLLCCEFLSLFVRPLLGLLVDVSSASLDLTPMYPEQLGALQKQRIFVSPKNIYPNEYLCHNTMSSSITRYVQYKISNILSFRQKHTKKEEIKNK